MTPFTFVFVTIGVGYASFLLTRFIVWLDGADEAEEENGGVADNCVA